MNCSMPGSSVHGILQARILEWAAVSFSRDLFNPGNKPRSPTFPADCLLVELLRNLPEHPKISILQFSSVAQPCPTLCDPMNSSTPGLLVHHQLPEFTQTHVHRVGDAIQPSHPLSSPSLPAPTPPSISLFQ